MSGLSPGRALAAELETSVRTVYRDIADLMAQRVPIRGEAGVGYVLDEGCDMPPLMLTPDEIEAAVLGAQWVGGRGDPALEKSARDLIAKINAVVPEHLRPMILDAASVVPKLSPVVADTLDMARLRIWIRTRGKLKIGYADESGRETQRIIWPIAIAYFEAVRLVVAWCELRQGFRHFRTDRIKSAAFLDDRYRASRRALIAAWKKEETAKNPGAACDLA